MRAKSIRGKLTLRFKAGGAVENSTLATNVSKGLSQVSRTKVTTQFQSGESPKYLVLRPAPLLLSAATARLLLDCHCSGTDFATARPHTFDASHIFDREA